MQARHKREDIPAIIRAAFPPTACSVEWRDHLASISVRFYGPDGAALFTTEAPTRELRRVSVLAMRIEHWRALWGQGGTA